MKPAELMTLTAMVMTTVPLAANPRADAIVAIRTYNYAQVPEEDFARAQHEAANIFQKADITLEWIVCRVPGNNDGESCTNPVVEGRDLMLRLVEDAHPNSDPALRRRALGESILDRDERAGVLMTLEILPIRAIAAHASTDMTTLLGRAIAHEVGHLLLGTADHSQIGLMRAFWSNDELRGVKPAHWGFSPREGAQMRQNLRVRACMATISSADCQVIPDHQLPIGN